MSTKDTPAQRITADAGNVLSGKRSTRRKARTLDVRLFGPGGVQYEGRTMDLSRGGMLLEITDPAFLRFTEESELLTVASHVMAAFPQGLTVAFGDGAVQVRAEVVRVASPSNPLEPRAVVGCRFVPELSEFSCRLLGVEMCEGMATDQADPLAAVAAAEALLPPGATSADAVDGSSFALEGEAGSRVVTRRRTAATSSTGAIEPNPVPITRAPREPEPAPRVAPPPPPPPAAPVAHAAPPARPKAASFPERGVPVAYLFSPSLGVPGPRFCARVLEVTDRRVRALLAAPEEDDVVGFAASLGLEVRIVVLLDGQVLWETRARVARIDPQDDAARLTLFAFREAPLPARRALERVLGTAAPSTREDPAESATVATSA